MVGNINYTSLDEFPSELVEFFCLLVSLLITNIKVITSWV